MKTSFKNYLNKKNAQDIIDKIANDYANQKIVLYGIENFTNDLFKFYDLSNLNILGIADNTYHESLEKEYHGYTIIKPDELLTMDFDLLLLTVYEDTDSKTYLKNFLFKGLNYKFKIKTLIKMNLIEYTKGLINGEF